MSPLPSKNSWLRGSLVAFAALLAILTVNSLRREKPERAVAARHPPAPRLLLVETKPSASSGNAILAKTSSLLTRKTPPHRSLRERLAEFSKMAAETDNPSAFDAYVTGWMTGLTPSDIPAALAFLPSARLLPDITVDFQARLVRQWAGANSAAALQWVNALPTGPLRERALENIAIVRSQQEFAAARQWASRLPPGEERDRVLATVANEAIRTQPAEALRLADNLPATPANDALIRRAAMDWAAQDSTQALQWARQLPDATFRVQVLSGVAVVWSDRDPVAAGRLAIEQLPPGRAQDDAIVSIAQRWAQHSPEAAAQWIDGFPNGPLKDAAVESVAAIWAQTDSKVATTWKTSLAAKSTRAR